MSYNWLEDLFNRIEQDVIASTKKIKGYTEVVKAIDTKL